MFKIYPVAVPSRPTIKKKLKFKILTAVPVIIFLLVAWRTGTSNDERLAFPANIQKIKGINIVLILSQISMQIIKS